MSNPALPPRAVSRRRARSHLTHQLGLLEESAGDPAAVRQLAPAVKDGLRAALDDLRDLARGIYPPLLADQSLVPALQAHGKEGNESLRLLAGRGYHPVHEHYVPPCTTAFPDGFLAVIACSLSTSRRRPGHPEREIARANFVAAGRRPA